MKTERLKITTGSRPAVVDVTDHVQRFVSGLGDGLVNIALLHATAGLALIELGSGSETDLIDRIEHLLPRENIYRHSHGSLGHGGDHLLPAFIAPTLTLPVLGGRVALGTWQAIAVVDTNVDNHERELLLSFLASAS